MSTALTNMPQFDLVSNDQALDWMRQYQTQKRSCQEANGVLRNIVKRAKADGINVTAMIATCEATKLDPDTVVKNVHDTVRYMSLRSIPVTAEAIFQNWDTRITEKSQAEDDIWTAEDQGYKAGRHGAAVESCTYHPGTELHVAWMTWWHRGQEAMAKELGPDAVQASAEKRPRGRPPGSTGRRRRGANGADAQAAAD